MGIILSVFTRIKVVYDCREHMFYSFLHSKTQYSRLMRTLLAYACRVIESLADITFDGIIFADPGTASWHSAAPECRKLVFYNAAPLDQFTLVHQPLEHREYDLVLLGGMTQRSGFGVLISMLDELCRADMNCKVLLVGALDPEAVALLEDGMKRWESTISVTVTARVPHETVPSLLQQAKVGLVLLLDLPKFQHNIASKAFEYMACGLPTIASDLAPQRHFLREGHTALFFPPGDGKAAAELVTHLLHNIPEAQAMGDRARRDAEEHWNCAAMQDQLRSFYRRITQKGSLARSADPHD
ncbi:MAG: glycosyltransferase family 4 protein [Chloroflexi bacterium]|nr:glycosyltransferase family 4 protein [Chloroflexota bacterium]